MNPLTSEEARRIFRATKKVATQLQHTTVIACPPFVFTSIFAKKTKESPVLLGAQDSYFETQGSYTGEVSAHMLKDLGVSHVIVGHSERRKDGETDEVISKKAEALLEAGIHPVLCVGETVRDEQGVYLDTLKNQIKDSMSRVAKKHIGDMIIAYEPVWAIGAKEAMNPDTVREMGLFVKKVISDLYGHDEAFRVPVLYGGSVNFRNAPDILVQGQVDGLLVGRESVNIPGFKELLKVVDMI